MSNATRALIETINPKGGNGMKETIVFLVIIAVLLTLNVLRIPVSNELQYALYTILGYMVGTNVKKELENSIKDNDDNKGA
jgi:hypothetical protein